MLSVCPAQLGTGLANVALSANVAWYIHSEAKRGGDMGMVEQSLEERVSRLETELTALKDGLCRQCAEEERDAEIALERLADIERDPSQLVSGEALKEALKAIVG